MGIYIYNVIVDMENGWCLMVVTNGDLMEFTQPGYVKLPDDTSLVPETLEIPPGRNSPHR